MKVAIAAASALLFGFSGTAAAQPASPALTANCSGFASPPSFPDGARATPREMNSGNEAYQNWGRDRLAKLTACRADIDALRAQLNLLEQAYISGNAELNATTAAWQAEVEEYNARGRR